MFAAAMSITATVQTDIWYWQDGKATKVESVDSITFAEPQAAAPVTTHEYVDLGLSVKWATCNVGAEKPEVTAPPDLCPDAVSWRSADYSCSTALTEDPYARLQPSIFMSLLEK